MNDNSAPESTRALYFCLSTFNKILFGLPDILILYLCTLCFARPSASIRTGLPWFFDQKLFYTPLDHVPVAFRSNFELVARDQSPVVGYDRLPSVLGFAH